MRQNIILLLSTLLCLTYAGTQLEATQQSRKHHNALARFGRGKQSSKNGAGYKYQEQPRNYWVPLTQEDRDTIRFMVTTLADKPIGKLIFYRSSLESAGDRINHVHPLRFLEAIFTCEQCKVGIRNMRRRDWVWSEFIKQTYNSLRDERNRNNITDEQIADFAKNVRIDYQLIAPPMNQGKWSEAVDILIVKVSREEGHDRYDW